MNADGDMAAASEQERCVSEATRRRVAAAKPSLEELLRRFDGWDGPEISGFVTLPKQEQS